MRLAAMLVLLTACAPIPASLPSVRIDRSLSGAVISREAAEVVAVLRERERGAWAKQIADEQRKTQTAEANERSARWWKDNAPWVVGGGSIAAFLLGVLTGGFVRPR